MGAIASTSEDRVEDYESLKQRNARKGSMDDSENEETGKERKIVLYGIGCAGKATIYRHIQMKLNLMPDREISMFKPNIYENLWFVTVKCAESCIKRYSKDAFENPNSYVSENS